MLSAIVGEIGGKVVCILLPGDGGMVLEGDLLERLTEASDMLGTGTKKGMSGWEVPTGRKKLRKAVEVLWNGTGGGDTRGV
jgi:hypothetical protein